VQIPDLLKERRRHESDIVAGTALAEKALGFGLWALELGAGVGRWALDARWQGGTVAVSSTSAGPRYRSFRDLTVWQQAMDLTLEVYAASRTLPNLEKFELAKDLRRTARSIPSNIAEGFNRHSRSTYRLHLAIALGSQAELETQVELATRLDYLSVEVTKPLQDRIATVGRLLHGLWRALAPQ
jgi:four helix bundle protein